MAGISPSDMMFRDTDKGFRRVMRELEALDGLGVTAGYHEGVTREDGTPMAVVAAVHEFGTKDGKVPPRPTLGPLADAKQRAYVARLQELLGSALTARSMEGALQVFGAQVVGDVQKAITELREPPLAPATIERRASRMLHPVTSTNPLVDTGAMRASVAAKIHKRGG